eukprot:TRINITY_DN5524_c0_g1_i1.p1 TRINITY_DN5524_c0_g1~~TRINITY_DN5524_c0_g1_i1.p1  ORF type:complete len:1027 (+),score=311.93 TRINITY_DN5524_c0_g1_i1:411-3083(+)
MTPAQKELPAARLESRKQSSARGSMRSSLALQHAAAVQQLLAGGAVVPIEVSESSSEPSSDGSVSEDADADDGARYELDETALAQYLSIMSEERAIGEVQRFFADRERELCEREDDATAETIEHSGDYARLYADLTEAETILDGISGKVSTFSSDLQDRAQEISHLQERSAEIRILVKSRESAQLFLAPAVRKLEGISLEWLRRVDMLSVEATAEGHHRELEQVFLIELRRLGEKLTYLEEDPVFARSRVREELLPRLRGASQRLAPRVAALLRAKLGELKETSNIRIQQQALAHRCGFAYRMLRGVDPAAARELLTEYGETMGKVYARNVRRLFEQVHRGEVRLPKGELIVPKDFFDPKKGRETQEKGGSLQQALSKKMDDAKRKAHLATEGSVPFETRIAALRAMVPSEDKLIIDPSVLLPNAPRCGPESFLQLMAELINSSVQEASFAAEFFALREGPREELLCAIFDKAQAFVKEKAQDAVAHGCVDLVGCLILLRISEALFTFLLPQKTGLRQPSQQAEISSPVPRSPTIGLSQSPSRSSLCDSPNPSVLRRSMVPGDAEAARRAASPAALKTTHGCRGADTAGAGVAQRSALRKFRTQRPLAALLKDLQSRLYITWSELIEQQMRSLREANQIQFTPLPPSTAHWGPHPCARRYAALATELHTLNTLPMQGSRVDAEGGVVFSDSVVGDLAGLRREVNLLLLTLSRRHQSDTARGVFLVSSYAELCGEGLPEGAEAAAMHAQAIRHFVTTHIRGDSSLGPVMEFVARAEAACISDPQSDADYRRNREGAGCAGTGGGAAAQTVRSFAAAWRDAMATAYSCCAKWFERPSLAVQMQQQVFMGIADLSDRLRRVLYLLWPEPPAKTQLVPAEVLRHEASTKYGILL